MNVPTVTGVANISEQLSDAFCGDSSSAGRAFTHFRAVCMQVRPQKTIQSLVCPDILFSIGLQ